MDPIPHDTIANPAVHESDPIPDPEIDNPPQEASPEVTNHVSTVDDDSGEEESTIEADGHDNASFTRFRDLPLELRLSVADFLDLKTLSALQRTSREFRACIMPLMIQWVLHPEWEVDESRRPTTVRYLVHAVQWNRVYMVKRLLKHYVPMRELKRAFQDSKYFFVHGLSRSLNKRPKTKAFRLVASQISEYIGPWDLSTAAEGRCHGAAVLKVLLPLAGAKVDQPRGPHSNNPIMCAAGIARDTRTMKLLLKAGANPHFSLYQDKYHPSTVAIIATVITNAVLSNYAPLQKVHLLESVGVSCESLHPDALRSLLARWSNLPDRTSRRKRNETLIRYLVNHGAPVTEIVVQEAITSCLRGNGLKDILSLILDAYGKLPGIELLRRTVNATQCHWTRESFKLMAAEVFNRASPDDIDRYRDDVASRLSKALLEMEFERFILESDDWLINIFDLPKDRMTEAWYELETIAVLSNREDELWSWVDPFRLARYGVERTGRQD
ncbi:hypothetical protein EX30DRAFT_119132 [Ascodesmis nigricans]|uniref:F-box domain-containing protein n=1 Tax=Ascodesmis nigricans TaxID=341454 RepID=A0A4S2MPS1_9PEZI|nr:hypothetical protein EX30DRAFT_119132 [Ascodesmis nigricans]